MAGPTALVRARIEAFREGGGEGKPVLLQVVLAYAATEQDALHAACDQWRQCTLSTDLLANLPTVRAFDDATASVTDADVRAAVRVSADINQHIDWLHEDKSLGIAGLYLHNVVREHGSFLDACGERLIPALAGRPA